MVNNLKLNTLKGPMAPKLVVVSIRIRDFQEVDQYMYMNS